MKNKVDSITKPKYKVKDLSLANWGRKEISLAESEMPDVFKERIC